MALLKVRHNGEWVIIPLEATSIASDVKINSDQVILKNGITSVTGDILAGDTVTLAISKLNTYFDTFKNMTLNGYLKESDADNKYVAKIGYIEYTSAEKTKLAGLTNYTLPSATKTALGGIKVGARLSIAADGTLNADVQNPTVDLSAYLKKTEGDNKYVAKAGYVAYSAAEKSKLAGLENYTLPTASGTVVGGVKIGSGLSVTPDGLLSASGVSVDLTPYLQKTEAETTYLKTTIADNTYLKKADYTPFTLPTASSSVLGGIKVGTGLTMAADGTLNANATPVDLSPYLKSTDAETTYLKKSDGDNKYVSKSGYFAFTKPEKDKLATLENYTLPVAEASTLGGVMVTASSGLKIDNLGHVEVDKDNLPFLKTSDASNTYISKTDVSNTYLKKTDAETTYLKSIPIASNTVLGGVKIGTGLTITSDGTLSANGVSVDLSPYLKSVDAEVAYIRKTAADTKYVAKEAGKGLSSNDFTTAEKNKLNSLNNYTLSVATASTLGGIKVGSGLTVETDGTLKATGVSVDLTPYLKITDANTKFVAKEAGKGLSKNDYTDADKNKLDSLNNYTLPKASTSVLGGVKVGDGLTVENDGTLKAKIVDLSAYLKSADASTTYLKKTDPAIKVANKLTIKNGGNTVEFDGSANKEITIAAGTSYTLPKATSTVLGGIIVQPAAQSGLELNDGNLKISVTKIESLIATQTSTYLSKSDASSTYLSKSDIDKDKLITTDNYSEKIGIARTDNLGLVKVTSMSDPITIDSNGILKLDTESILSAINSFAFSTEVLGSNTVIDINKIKNTRIQNIGVFQNDMILTADLKLCTPTTATTGPTVPVEVLATLLPANNPTVTGTLTAPTITATETMNIPGGSISIET